MPDSGCSGNSLYRCIFDSSDAQPGTGAGGKGFSRTGRPRGSQLPGDGGDFFATYPTLSSLGRSAAPAGRDAAPPLSPGPGHGRGTTIDRQDPRSPRAPIGALGDWYDAPGMAAAPTIAARHIAVEGPIGVGKTSLVELLAQRFEGVKVLEDVQNPFLEPFYRGRPGAAFQVQVFFLLSRYQQHVDIAQRDLFTRLVVADYSMPKDWLFARINLDDEEFRLYDRLYQVLAARLPSPDLVIYLEARVDTCLHRIRLRGREYERSIDPEYLRRLKEAYNTYFFRYNQSPLLVVNTDEIDFVNNPQDFENLIQQIARIRQGTQVYVPLGSGERTETGRGTPPKPAS